MHFKQRMLHAFAGRPCDQLPWVPRLDLWFKANHRAGTLPRQYAHATLPEILADLDWGHHAVIPDFKDLRSPEDEADRGLGQYNLDCMPHQTYFDGADRTVKIVGDRTEVVYACPAGTLRTAFVYDDAMRQAGVTITHIAEPAVKTVADLEVAGWLFEHARVEPHFNGYARFAERIGPRGLAVAYVDGSASPMHLIQKELMECEPFFFALHDHPREMARLAERIGVYWQRVMEIVAQSPAEVLFVGANFDSRITSPPFFRKHITPWLQRYAERLHRVGKYLLTHCDGENRGLLPHYLEARFDIADSICPAPMTQLSFGEVRQAFGSHIAIMGGIPSVALLRDVMSDAEFERFLDGFFYQIGGGERLVLGISDTTPPGADFNRLKRVAARVREFGPVRGNTQ